MNSQHLERPFSSPNLQLHVNSISTTLTPWWLTLVLIWHFNCWNTQAHSLTLTYTEPSTWDLIGISHFITCLLGIRPMDLFKACLIELTLLILAHDSYLLIFLGAFLALNKPVTSSFSEIFSLGTRWFKMLFFISLLYFCEKKIHINASKKQLFHLISEFPPKEYRHHHSYGIHFKGT